jgi:sec-independent protein translocase protein TatA
MFLPVAFGFDLFGIQGFLILAIVGLLLYGERLPEVAASFGKHFLQLKKSVQGIRSEIESVAYDARQSVERGIEKGEESWREEATAPKFEPPPSEPVVGQAIPGQDVGRLEPPTQNKPDQGV